jgi:hypothetical protein
MIGEVAATAAPASSKVGTVEPELTWIVMTVHLISLAAGHVS